MARRDRRRSFRRPPRTRTLRKPRPTARQEHRDAPLSRRGRVLWWVLVAAIVLAGVGLLVFGR